MDSTKILLSPVVTEKSTNAQALRKYLFLVHLDANKSEVKKAIEISYGVKVKSIRMMPVLKKSRVGGRGITITKRHTGKKAIVTLELKNSIDFNKIKI